MRIISWNCCCKFREKYRLFDSLDADIMVIQECENPETSKQSDYRQFATNFIWDGDIQHKGIGVFVKQSIEVKRHHWDNNLGLKWFVPVSVDNDFTLLAVWACVPYIEEHMMYLDAHFDKYDKDMVVIGDLNSNPVFDKKKAKRIAERKTHLDLADRLSSIGLCSAYHFTTNEKQGEEATPTFYMYRKTDEGYRYHLDHCFVDGARIKSYAVLNRNEVERNHWLRYSDHIPIVLEI